MHIKSIVAGVAIALAATIGLASAAEQFATLERVTAEPMKSDEMAAVTGEHIIIFRPGGASVEFTIQVPDNMFHVDLVGLSGGRPCRGSGLVCHDGGPF